MADDDTAAVTFGADGQATGYVVVDEIAGRALRSGGHVLAVRKEDIPAGNEIAAALRYPI